MTNKGITYAPIPISPKKNLFKRFPANPVGLIYILKPESKAIAINIIPIISFFTVLFNDLLDVFF
ncbi:hypothetical protein Q428_09180 [Fervidicella metallireducens AeB]|uniref:Uncharacterized protein n=1 Tax=Fervidicella metallireducens AeB TaxID=1403537 RepID=A0A017RTV5_9CLOT|nr:hypothetical protein Q428_09180 [Fervidicella metallireducens AeB]